MMKRKQRLHEKKTYKRIRRKVWRAYNDLRSEIFYLGKSKECDNYHKMHHEPMTRDNTWYYIATGYRRKDVF